MNWSSRLVRWTAPLLALPAAAALVLAASPALAADPSQAGVDAVGPCAALASSFDAHGAHLSQLYTRARVAASQSAPFVVAHDGTVHYETRTPTMPNNTWTVSVAGVKVGSGHSGHIATGHPTVQTVKVSDRLPASVTGLAKVDVDIAIPQGSVCTLTTWIKLDGNGWTSLNGLLGLGLLALGLVGLAFSRGHWLRGLMFGSLAGFGVGMLLVSLSVIPLGTIWLPLAIVGVGLVVGLLFGKLTSARGAKPQPT